MSATLTGTCRYRTGFRKKLILQVEELVKYGPNYGPYGEIDAPAFQRLEWRDAKIEDLSHLQWENMQTHRKKNS